MIKNFFILAFIVVFAQSCYKTDHRVVNLNDNRIDVLGHAGMGISNSYPINSFESIANALAIGADGTELDVQLSADGKLVVFHDEFLENSSNKSGIVNDLNWSEIEDGFYNTVPYHDYKILQLETIFSNIDDLQKYRFALDCKLFSSEMDSTYLQKFALEIIRVLDKYQVSEKTIIESPEPELLELIKNETDRYRLFWYVNEIPSILSEAENWPVDGFTIRNEDTSAEEIKTAHDLGYLIALYNTQTKSDNIEAIEKNPDIIQTDKLKHLIKVLK